MNKEKDTFSQKVKKEIVSLQFQNHCLKALLSSFLSSHLSIVLKSNNLVWQVSTQFEFVKDFIVETFNQLYEVKIKQHTTTSLLAKKEKNYYLEITGNFDQIEEELCLRSSDKSKLLSRECCRRAYIAGAFLASGSVSSLNQKWYHLEIRSCDYQFLLYLQNILTTFNISITLYKRSSQYVLYIKKADQISDFLKIISVVNCMMDFEDVKISRDYKVQMVRFNNLDISNLNKAAIAGVEQIKYIEALLQLDVFKKQSYKFRTFCKRRVENQSASLSQLSLILLNEDKINVTRTGLNHFVIKLKELYQKHVSKIKPNTKK